MTPRIPRGWTRATERGSGVWVDYVGGGWRAALGGGALLPERTYIRRTDPSVSTDPNHALRLEDEAARVDPDAEPMVPGMMRLSGGQMVPLAGLTWGRVGDGSGTWVAPAEWEHETTPLHDFRTPAEFAAAFTAAWEYTERRRAAIAADDAEGQRLRRIEDAARRFGAVYGQSCKRGAPPDLGSTELMEACVDLLGTLLPPTMRQLDAAQRIAGDGGRDDG